MLRLRLGTLITITALWCAGCVVATDTPNPPTPALITATKLPATVVPPSATALAIVTATASLWAPPTSTASSAAPSATLLPGSPLPTVTPQASVASSTPIPSETSTAPAGGDTPPPATAPPATAPPATAPPATALPVGITQFSIQPASINPGDSITLTWQATGQQAAIYRQEPGGPLTDMHTVPLSGTLVLRPPAELRNQVTYILYAGAGASTASATVSAVILCPDKWFFAPSPAGCPGGPGALVAMAAERFQHGLMIWVSGQDRIYILFGEGSNPAWSAQANTWFAGQPETDPSLLPPAGLFQPVRGFGAAWRATNAPPGLTVRDRLGWATEAEAALTGGYQCDSAPKYNHCYLSGPGGQVYHLLPEFSGWQVWHGP